MECKSSSTAVRSTFIRFAWFTFPPFTGHFRVIEGISFCRTTFSDRAWVHTKKVSNARTWINVFVRNFPAAASIWICGTFIEHGPALKKHILSHCESLLPLCFSLVVVAASVPKVNNYFYFYFFPFPPVRPQATLEWTAAVIFLIARLFNEFLYLMNEQHFSCCLLRCVCLGFLSVLCVNFYSFLFANWLEIFLFMFFNLNPKTRVRSDGNKGCWSPLGPLATSVFR